MLKSGVKGDKETVGKREFEPHRHTQTHAEAHMQTRRKELAGRSRTSVAPFSLRPSFLPLFAAARSRLIVTSLSCITALGPLFPVRRARLGKQKIRLTSAHRTFYILTCSAANLHERRGCRARGHASS